MMMIDPDFDIKINLFFSNEDDIEIKNEKDLKKECIKKNQSWAQERNRNSWNSLNIKKFKLLLSYRIFSKDL